MVTLYLLLGLVYNSQNQTWNTEQYASLWTKVEKALSAGKPQTAAQYLAELEKMTRSTGDELERLQVSKQRYECLSQYNWKEARDYYPRYSSLQDSMFRNLDANIEKYCKHPRVIMLISEKISRLKSEEDRKADSEKNDEVYQNIRKMCQQAIKAFPKTTYARQLQGIIDEMDSPWLYFNGADKGYPGVELKYEVSLKNIPAAEFKVYKLSGRYNIADAEKFAKYDSGSPRCILTGSKKLDSLRNRYNISETVSTAWTFDEPGLYVVKISDGKETAPFQYVYISRVAAALRQVGGHYEVYAADAMTGKPFDRTRITAYKENNGKGLFLSPTIYSTKEYDQDGFVVLNQKLYESPWKYAQLAVAADGDDFSSPFGIDEPYVRPLSHVSRISESMYVYTDRKLYRPTDEIQFKVIDFTTDGAQGGVIAGKEIEVNLYAPAQDKPAATVKVMTNAYGSASGSFKIPEDSKNGTYRISAGLGSATVRVEEYVTPDFYMEMPTMTGLYTFDDVITQTGSVKGYAGIAMAGAKVEYTVRSRTQWRIWSPALSYSWKIEDSGSVTTDASGKFAISFKTVRPDFAEDEQNGKVIYNIEIKVTDRQGETHEMSKSITVADIPLELSTGFASEVSVNRGDAIAVNRDVEKYILIDGVSCNGIAQAVDGTYRLMCGGSVQAEGRFTTGREEPVDFSKLPSGEYTLEYEVLWRGRSISGSRKVALFSPSDRTVPVSSKLFFYPLEDNGGIEFFLGTSEEDLYIELEIFDKEDRLYRMPLHLRGEARRISLPYLASYNDCVELSLFTFRNYEEYKITHSFRRPVESAYFTLGMESFRDRTAPDTEESFVVKGKPSELTVSIFDITTDRYGANRFYFSPLRAYTTYSPSISTNISRYVRMYKNTSFDSMVMMSRSAAPMTEMMVMDDMAYGAAVQDVEEAEMEEDAGEGQDSDDVRSDFGETIAFLPHIEIGSDSTAVVRYRTRQAFGTYRVLVLAHDTTLHSGSAESKFIVQKELMVMPSLPLFATEGDQIVLKSVVANVSNREIKGTARIAIEDAATGRKLNLGAKDKKVTLAADGQTEVEWTVTVPDAQKIFVTISVEGDGISDGEKNAIEIVPQVQEITETASFVLGGPHGRKYYENQLKTRIGAKDAVIRYEEYSTLDAVRKALAAPERPVNDNMIDWLNALYVNQTRMKISEPADIDLTVAAVTALNTVQHSDGSYSWFPCMWGSDMLTLLFLEKISQLGRMGVAPEGLENSIKKAVRYIDGRIEAIASVKNWSYNSLIEYFAVRSQYLDLQMSASLKNIFSQFLTKSEKDWQTLPILTKARLTNILLRTRGTEFFRNAFESRIKLLSESLADYAVLNKTVGCYFPNAVMPFRGLMNNEIYAHAELQELFWAVGNKQIVSGLQQWMLLQKHNQAWESNMATADAVFSLLSHDAEDLRLGAVYYTYKAPMQEVKEAANELSVRRTFYRDGKELADGDILRVGDRIEVRYDLWSSENRSFVQVHAMRPACFYPVDERSYGSTYFYKEQSASGTEYYFQLLAEEDTGLSETFYVSQEGVFNKGLVEVESLYAPEYRGHTAGGMITSE